MPNVIMDKKKYAHVLDFQPLGFNVVWLIIKLPINPRKKVNKKRTKLLLFCIKNLLCNSINYRSFDLYTNYIRFLDLCQAF